MLLLIGWRGEPGTRDEPQHVKQGAITLDLLDTLGVRYALLPSTLADAKIAVQEAVAHMQNAAAPYALVVRRNTFDRYSRQTKPGVAYPLTREAAIHLIAQQVETHAAIVATTGKASRELFEYRQAQGMVARRQGFLAVGGMGHAAQIALGIALSAPNRPVYCLDGDGALLMHMGGWQ